MTNSTDAQIQAQLTDAIRRYTDRVEQMGAFAPTEPGALTATQGMIVASAILRAVNVQVFELAMCETWAH